MKNKKEVIKQCLRELVWLGDSGVDPVASDHSFLRVMENCVKRLGIHVVDWAVKETSSNDEWDLSGTSTGAHKKVPELLGTGSVLVEEWKELVLGWKADTEGEITVGSGWESLARALSWFVGLENLHKVLQRSSHSVTDVAVHA